jgi:hypothetical protein
LGLVSLRTVESLINLFWFFSELEWSLMARETGTREKVSSRRINLEGNTYAQEINVSQLPI